MSVSSYLEAFLTMYGWEMYYVLYLLFAATGLFLYPFIRVLNDVYVSYLSGSEYAATNYVKQMIVSLSMVFLVFVFAIVPGISVELNNTTVKSVCEEKKDAAKYISKSYFNNTETRVPLMPYLAMSLAQGINSVIYNKTPCTLDITEANKAIMAVDLSQAEDPELLRNELNRFIGECHQPARVKVKEILDNKYGEQVAQRLQQLLKTQIDNMVNKTGIDDRKRHEAYLLNNYDSSLLRGLFYTEVSPLKLFKETRSIPPLVAAGAVDGVPGYDPGSQQQDKNTPPSCGQWWSGSNGLRFRVVDAMEQSVAVRIGSNMGIPECKTTWRGDMTNAMKKSCINRITTDRFSGRGGAMTTALFQSIQGKGLKDSVLSSADNWKLSGIVTAGIGGALLAKVTGEDLSGGIIGQAASFYMTIFILKLMLKYFLPMILMSVYMFWGIYLLVGEFKGMTMIKGMILIIALCMMPALWAVIDHLDDSLWKAMYGNRTFTDAFEMILLDITTGIFQIAIVFVLFFLIGEAGGGNAGGAVSSSQKHGEVGARGVGSAAGKGTGTAASQGAKTGGGHIRNRVSDAKYQKEHANFQKNMK